MSGLPHPATPRELQAVMAAERAGEPFLLFRSGADELVIAVLGGADVLSVGRAAAADVVLDWDPGVSAVHAELTPLGGAWLIADEGLSRNGTFVNGERLSGRRRLRGGDTIRAGHTSLAFHDGSETAGGLAGATAPLTAAGAGPVGVTEAQRRVLGALCRPYLDGSAVPLPATNQTIADELFLSVEAVKTHLRELYRRFALEELAQNEKRAVLAHRAIEQGLAVTPRP